MLKAEIEVDSLSVVTDISEICTKKNKGFVMDRDESHLFYIPRFKFERYLALTGADTHVAVFSVKGVSEQPQTLCVTRTESFKCL